MKETLRRRYQLGAWVRHQIRYLRDDQASNEYATAAKKAAAELNNIICADSAADTRAAAAHMLRVYRQVRGFGVTRFLDDIRFLTRMDQAWDALVDPVVFNDLGVMKDCEQFLNRFGEERPASFAFDVCSEAFLPRLEMTMDLVNLILIDRAERMVKKWSERIPPNGMRVELPPNGSIDRFPHFLLQGELTGTVVHHEPGQFVVKVDQHEPDLDDWENEVSYVDTVEHFWDEWVPLKETA